MVNLETKSVEIQNHMYDSVTQDFDRVSNFNDNGLNPLQGQQDEQTEGVNRTENAIDNDVVYIMTLYPPRSPIQMTDVIIIKLLVTEIEKKYKTNYTKTHQSKLKTIIPI